jgi:hypothetical protein
MKNYRLMGEEMEVLGRRLDAARKSLATARSEWSKNYWKQAVDRLLFQWQQLPILHDGDAQTTIIPKWSINYDFYERQEEGNLYGVTDRAYDKLFKHDARLEESWENHRAQRLAKAQF